MWRWRSAAMDFSASIMSLMSGEGGKGEAVPLMAQCRQLFFVSG
jgi:hypothetical protein